jgi:lipoprotein-anchoring transpeptidase ErfK/SrfK
VKKPLYSSAVAAAPFCVVAIALAGLPETGPGATARAPAQPSLMAPPLLPLEQRRAPRTGPPHQTPRRLAARVRTAVIAYDAPGRGAVAQLDSRTEFGSPQVLPVAGRRGPWLRVLADVPSRRSAWIRRSHAVDLHRRDIELVVDRSRRTLTVVDRGHAVRRLPVAVGRPDSPTPLGRFAVTDRLSGAPYGGAYGCCVLALSGRQKRLPAGWTGGDRLAIHATERPNPTEGGSAGCVVASDDSLRYLMRRVPVGTMVTIRR